MTPSIGGAALLAISLCDFSIFGLGLPLLGFFANLLVMGWAIGLLVPGLVLRLGLGAGAFLLAFNSARQRGLLLHVGE